MSEARRVLSSRCLIVGEVAQAHEGSLGMAHAFIDAIADAGADAVKFQIHIAAAESTHAEPWRVKFSEQDVSRYSYWKRMEFTEPQWGSVRRHAAARGLKFVCSPFSIEALELVDRVGADAWKVASGEITNRPMLDRIAATGRAVFISTGMSSLTEVDAAVALLQQHAVELAVLQCTSEYPCPAERVGLNMVPCFRERYGCAVGLSDHSGTIFPGLAAATLGIDVLEVHVTLSREMFGPDVCASITTGELRQLVAGVRFIEKMTQSGVDKDGMAREMTPMRALFTKSLVARVDLEAGTVLQEGHLTAKKPGTGIPATALQKLVGRRLSRSVRADQLLRAEDLEVMG